MQYNPVAHLQSPCLYGTLQSVKRYMQRHIPIYGYGWISHVWEE